MGTTRQLRRGTTAEHSTFTGVEAEVTVDTDKKRVVVHDGVTAGGKVIDPSFEEHNLYSLSPSERVNSGVLVTKAHGLGTVPRLVKAYFVWRKDIFGYFQNEEMDLSACAISNDGGQGIMVSADATNVYLVIGDIGGGDKVVPILRRDTGSVGLVTLTDDLDIKILAWK